MYSAKCGAPPPVRLVAHQRHMVISAALSRLERAGTNDAREVIAGRAGVGGDSGWRHGLPDVAWHDAVDRHVAEEVAKWRVQGEAHRCRPNGRDSRDLARRLVSDEPVASSSRSW